MIFLQVSLKLGFNFNDFKIFKNKKLKNSKLQKTLEIKTFISSAEYSDSHPNQKNCDFDTLPNKEQVCKLDVEKFGECVRSSSYGYNNSAPCIFLKLNRIYDWVPEYYNDTSDLPSEMPKDLVDHIKSLKAKERNQVWVSCKGEDGSDKENIGKVEYFPNRGFPSYFYPYVNTKNYVSPLVAVKFQRPGSEFEFIENLKEIIFKFILFHSKSNHQH